MNQFNLAFIFEQQKQQQQQQQTGGYQHQNQNFRNQNYLFKEQRQQALSDKINAQLNKKQHSTASFSSSDTKATSVKSQNDSKLSKSYTNSYVSTIPLRFRGQSTSSTNSNSLSSQNGNDSTGDFSSVVDEKLATTGNMFQRREDWSVLNKVPLNKQNTLHIRLEDEGPYGNDETRCFVLAHFSMLRIKSLCCVFCECELTVYDRFPLIDGTLYLSPITSQTKPGISAIVNQKQQYIYAVCLKCLNGQEENHRIACVWCQKLWNKIGGLSLQIGTLYKFDVFSAFPCCQKRTQCKNCSREVIDLVKSPFPYFSMYSEKYECPACFVNDYHFVKPVDQIYEKVISKPMKASVDDDDNDDNIFGFSNSPKTSSSLTPIPASS
jgi:headcase protein